MIYPFVKGRTGVKAGLLTSSVCLVQVQTQDLYFMAACYCYGSYGCMALMSLSHSLHLFFGSYF